MGHRHWRAGVLCLAAAVVFTGLAARAEVAQGSPAPAIPRVVDVHGRTVDWDELRKGRDLVVLFFFTRGTGEEIARKLGLMDRARIETVAIGVKEDEAALAAFAKDLNIDYYLVPDRPELQADSTYGPFPSLPVTFMVTPDATVLKVLRGGGQGRADLITQLAQAYLQQGKADQARQLATKAAETGEDARSAAETRGYALVDEGKLDDAAAEFGRIDSKAGLAAVALEKGNLDEAMRIADQAGADQGYARTVKGKALARTGKLDEAAKAFDEAASLPADDWQKSQALTGKGRVSQEKGDLDGALGAYHEAVALDAYNVRALSNEGEALRANGNLDGAEKALQTASARNGNDALVTMMLRQVREDLKRSADTQRKELVRKQIADLRKRYDEMKAAGLDKKVDSWTTPPLVLALLPSPEASGVFFERAGTDVALRRELEARLQTGGAVQVVEREVLDSLLQELNLGSSDLADADTQLRLGRVLSAPLLGFIDFARTGSEVSMYLRLVDTETTAIAAQFTRPVPVSGDGLNAVVDGLAADVVQKLGGDRPLQGLIADVAQDGTVLLNLGAAHGVKPGQRFTVLQAGAPIEVGGKTIEGRTTPVATLEVTEVEPQLSVCTVKAHKEGVTLAREMKVKRAAQ